MAAWATLGASAQGYDPTRDAISRLAAIGAPTRPAMTAGLLALAGGMTLYALAQRSTGAATWVPALANGLLTAGVAAFPLGGSHDTLHGAVAALGYVTLAAIPLAAGRRTDTTATSARWSTWAGVATALLLLASLAGPRHGLAQRAGLTVGQLWVVVSALGLARSSKP